MNPENNTTPATRTQEVPPPIEEDYSYVKMAEGGATEDTERIMAANAEKMNKEAQEQATAEESKRTAFAAAEARKAKEVPQIAKLLAEIQGGAVSVVAPDGKYEGAPPSVEKVIPFTTAQDIVEFAVLLGKMKSYEDPVAGEIDTTKYLSDVIVQLNLDLGQAYGFMRDSGSYEGTPRRIAEEVFAKIGNFPSAIQRAYWPLAYKYIDDGINEFTKK